VACLWYHIGNQHQRLYHLDAGTTPD
jgi:hypothetical protein